MRSLILMALLLLAGVARGVEDPPPTATPFEYMAERGVYRSTLETPYQKGKTVVDVLLPEKYDASKAYKVVYVLPVETGVGGRFGDGLMEIRKLGLHDQFGVICATMSFDTVPWYADHASDPKVRQETYVRHVVGLVEAKYKTPGDRGGRLLLGFSKSGWGAVSLLLRNPDFYGFAASWDAPLMLAEADWNSFAIPMALGTVENFAKYRPAALAGRAAESVKASKRLVITGEASFGAEPGGRYKPEGHTVAFHRLLEGSKVPHAYDDSLKVPHTWGSGWAKPTFEMLMGLAN
jgi:hypothetical protein